MLFRSSGNEENKVQKVMDIFRMCKVDEWANTLKEKYFSIAMKHLEDLAVSSSRKSEMESLARFLIQRDS